MISINQGSNAAIILLHEIYGINAHMRELGQSLAAHKFDVYVPNLLTRTEPYEYAQEDEAYANFMANVGFAQAKEKASKLIRDQAPNYKRVYVVGFSVGATVAWLCSQEAGLAGVVGYYGSRIRSYLDVAPQCRTLLLFAEEEKSFDVPDVSAVLDQKPNVETVICRGRHGFADPYSASHNDEAAKRAFGQMLAFLKR